MSVPQLPATAADARARLIAEVPVAAAAALPVLERLAAAGHEAWLVGGVVRDVLLGRAPGAPDVATAAPPEGVMDLFPGAIPTGLKHGTVTVVRDGTPVEITTFRVDAAYSDGRHPDHVTFVRSIEEDLARRDLTINAMAFDTAGGRFLDPHGGLGDLRSGLIRAVGDPARRFQEDGLRPYRAVRLATTLGFELDAATREAIPGALPRAARVSPERVRDELNKTLAAAERPSRGIELLRETGLLSLVMPELFEGYGVAQNRWHAFDVYTHALAVLDAAPREKPLVRLAALLHDVAKPRTKAVVDGEGTFYNHQHVGSALVREILTRLRYPGETVETVAHLVDSHMFHYEEAWSDAAVRRFIRRVGPGFVADLFDLRLADTLGNGLGQGFPHDLERLRARIEAELAAQAALSVRDLAIGGAEVMAALNVPGGPVVGRALEFLLEKVLDDPGLNTPEALLEKLRMEFPERA